MIGQLLEQHIRNKAAGKMAEYQNKVEAAKEDLHSETDPLQAPIKFEKLLKAAEFPAGHGLVGHIKHFLQGNARAHAIKQAQEQYPQPKAPSGSSLGIPGAPAPPNFPGGPQAVGADTTTLNYAGMPFQPPPPPPGMAGASPPPQSPAKVDRGLSGAGSALAADSTGQPAPVNAAAGAGAASPPAQAAAANPWPAVPPPGPGFTPYPTRHAQAAAMLAEAPNAGALAHKLTIEGEAKRSGEMKEVAQRIKLMGDHPELFGDLDKLAKAQVALGLAPQRGFTPRMTNAGTRVLTQAEVDEHPLDLISNTPLKAGDAVTVFMQNGAPAGYSRKDMGGKAGSLVQLAPGVFGQGVYHPLTNQLLQVRVAPGTPLNALPTQHSGQTISWKQDQETGEWIGLPTPTSSVTQKGSAPPVQGAPIAPTTPPPAGMAPSTPPPAKAIAPATPPPRTGVPRGAIKSGVFGKPPGSMTEFQKLTAEGKLGAFDSALDVAQNVRKNADLFTSMVTAEKIRLEADPDKGILKAVVARNVPLTPQEAQLAADFNQLSEHIGVMRIPLGGGGFRGHEAWVALQSMRGDPRANPEVTKRVLDTTISSMQKQRDVLAKHVGPITPATPPPPALPEAARKQLKEGFDTTFANGQVWTLKGGKETRVK